MKCISCGQTIGKESTVFDCPGCKKEKIVRCRKCRRLAVPYTGKCGFQGP